MSRARRVVAALRLLRVARNAAALLAIFVVAVLAVLVAQKDTSSAQPPFDPGAFTCFEIIETSVQCDGDSPAGAVTDLHSRFCIGWSDDCSAKDSPVIDSNSGGIIEFTPEDYTVPSGNDLPLGAVVGRFTSEATLGLLNNPCNTTIQVVFTIMNASIDISDTIDPKPPGQIDVLEPLALDANNNGLPDGVDRYPSFLNETFDNTQPRARLFGISLIQGSWVSLNILFLEPGATLEMANQTVTLDPGLGVPSLTVLNNPEAPDVPSVISDFCTPCLTHNVILGQTIDNPCTPAPVNGAACPGTTIFENRGYPLFPCETGNKFDEDGDGKINDGCPQVGGTAESGAQCDNNTSDDFEDSNVNDGCPVVGDQSENERLGGGCSGADEGGCVFRQNPGSDGAVNFTTFAASQRDADGDGIENSLDVCALDPNPGWNPRGIDAVNDPDGDGLPNECDPDAGTAGDLSPAGCNAVGAGQVGPDEDQDCYNNRQDNCPVDNQLENPAQSPGSGNPPNAVDTDGDGIGDACDPNPNDADAQGEPAFVCLEMALQVGGASKAVATPHPDQSLNCAVILDADNDLVYDADETACGGDALDPNVRPERLDGTFAGQDDDGDTLVDEPLPAGAEDFDCDGDGYTGSTEDHVYSYAAQTNGDQKTCQEYDTSYPNPHADIKPSLRWPSDLNKVQFPLDSFNRISVQDLTSFLAPVYYLGTDVGTNPGDVRWDLVPGKGIFSTDINIQDLTALIAPAAPSGAPPMLGGVRALGGPVCPYTP